MNLAEQILAAQDITYEPVDVPEWGLKVFVKGLTGTERDDFEASIRQMRPTADRKSMEPVLIPDNMRSKMLVKCLVDEQGQRIFTDQQINALGAKNGAVLDRLHDVASRLSGMDGGAVDRAEANFSIAPSAGTTSPSPELSDAPSPSY
jgi:hypothetical protein